MRLPVSRFLMLVNSISERINEEAKGRLVEQAYGAWLVGGKLHSFPLVIAQMQGARFSRQAIDEFAANYPTLPMYLKSLGLLEES